MTSTSGPPRHVDLHQAVIERRRAVGCAQLPRRPPGFPHESTANQFFSESQFESYRVLGEHIARDVFGDAVRDAGPDPSPAMLFSTLRRRWVQAPPNLDKDFLESMKPFVKIHEALRTDPKLEGLSHELYPGARRSDGTVAAPAPSTIAPTFMPSSRCSRPWRSLDRGEPRCLLGSPAQPRLDECLPPLDQLGHLPAHWPAVRGEFSEGFVRFCETELNLTVQEPKFAWLEARAARIRRPNDPALGVPRRLAGARQRVLARMASHCAPRDQRGPFGSVNMFEHAYITLRTRGMADGRSDPARRDSHDGRPTSEPCHYGVILAWGSSDDVVELVVWLRSLPNAWARRSNRENDSMRSRKSSKRLNPAATPSAPVTRAMTEEGQATVAENALDRFLPEPGLPPR